MAERNPNGELPRPKIGLGCLIRNDLGQILFGERQGSHGVGEWQMPGGHLEMGDNLAKGVADEVAEETGLIVRVTRLVSVADELRYLAEGKHYVDLVFEAEVIGGTLEVKEPHKCRRWVWFDENDLPSPLMDGTEQALRNMRNSVIYTLPI